MKTHSLTARLTAGTRLVALTIAMSFLQHPDMPYAGTKTSLDSHLQETASLFTREALAPISPNSRAAIATRPRIQEMHYGRELVFGGEARGRNSSPYERILQINRHTGKPFFNGAYRKWLHAKLKPNEATRPHATIQIYVCDTHGRMLFAVKNKEPSPSDENEKLEKLRVSVSAHVNIEDALTEKDRPSKRWALNTAVREFEEELGTQLDKKRLFLASKVMVEQLVDPRAKKKKARKFAEKNDVKEKGTNHEFTMIFYYFAADAEIPKFRRKYNSDENKWYWLIPLRKIKKKELSGGVRHLLKMYPHIFAKIKANALLIQTQLTRLDKIKRADWHPAIVPLLRAS